MARSFNNTSDDVTLSDRVTSAVDNFSVHAWIKPVINQVTGCVFYNGNDSGGWGMFVGDAFDSSSNKLVGLYGGIAWVDPAAATTLTNDVWASAGFGRDGGTAKLVKDGTINTTSVTSAPNTPTSGWASIGMQFSSSDTEQRHYDGTIAEVAVWDVFLTQAEWDMLADGFSALFIRPANLIYYTPLLGYSAEPNLVGGATNTIGGTTVVPHYKVIYPHGVYVGLSQTGEPPEPSAITYITYRHPWVS